MIKSSVMIDKNIPIPKDAGRKGRRKYPFYEMEVGDSVFFEGQTRTGNARNAAYAWARNNNKEVSVRSVQGGIRIWRIA